MNYQHQPWFALLRQAVANANLTRVATALNVSVPMLSQVLNGKGKYGGGQASTARLAERVVHTYGRYECPHLSERHAETRVITADTCRAHAHRPAPASSPLDMQHWQACNACPHKPKTAPAPPREIKRRKPRVTPIQMEL